MGQRKNKEVACWFPFWKNGSWKYDFYVDGKRYRASTGVCDPEALEIAKKVSEGLFNAAWDRALSPYPSFAEAAEIYSSDIGKNRVYLERLVAYFGPFVRINDIDAFAMNRCVADLAKPSWTSRETARRSILVPLNAVIKYALGLRPEARDVNGRTRILTPEEAEQLIAVAMRPPKTIRDPHLRLLKMIAFLLGSGVTPGEMFCVRAEDINRATGEIWIRGNETGAGKTPYRRRMVHLPTRAWDLIGELPQEGRVFLRPSGKPVIPDGKRGSPVVRQFNKLCVAAGLNRDNDAEVDETAEAGYEKLVFYSLRHTWATWFSAQVGDQDLLLDRGGWANADMARHYREQVPRDFADRLRAHGWDFAA